MISCPGQLSLIRYLQSTRFEPGPVLDDEVIAVNRKDFSLPDWHLRSNSSAEEGRMQLRPWSCHSLAMCLWANHLISLNLSSHL